MTVIGILAPMKGKSQFPGYYKNFTAAGKALGAVVYLFLPPEGGRFAGNAWQGYVPSGDGWALLPVPPPDIVINRFARFLRSPVELENYYHFRDKSGLLFANHTVDDKFHLYQRLGLVPGIAAHLPETKEFQGDALQDMLDRCELVYIKPKNGTGGRGVYRIEREDGGARYRLHGHDIHRRSRVSETLGRDELCERMLALAGSGGFLVQQGLNLRLIPGRNIDLRLLLQKENGSWTTTGTAIRAGKPGSPVSNLHGGGTGHRSEPFLAERFGKGKAAQILGDCRRLALDVAQAIEAAYGRMLELGFDLGIDTTGKVWLIEVNTMPQRDLFRVTGQRETYNRAFARPIAEAIRLAKETQAEKKTIEK